jgi:hypothetical protein
MLKSRLSTTNERVRPGVPMRRSRTVGFSRRTTGRASRTSGRISLRTIGSPSIDSGWSAR